MTPEKRVQNKILEYLRKLENEGKRIFFQRRQAGGFSYHKGLPDIYCVYNGIHIEIEVKAPGGHQSEMQIKWQKRFEEIGIKYICCSDLNDLRVFINNL